MEETRAEKALKSFDYVKDNQGVYVKNSITEMWKKIDEKDGGGWACFKYILGELIQVPYYYKHGGLIVNDVRVSGTLANPKVGDDYNLGWSWPEEVVAQTYEEAYKVYKS